ncbi:pseudouridine synthase [Desulfovibrio sp. 86]
MASHNRSQRPDTKRPASRSESRPASGAHKDFSRTSRADINKGIAPEPSSPTNVKASSLSKPVAHDREAAVGGKASGKPSPAYKSDSGTESSMRLNKAIAASGLCSRRKADEFILAGRVVVNGVPEVNPGRQVQPNDAVAVDGRLLNDAQHFCYLMLYKPVQVVCTVSDPEGRPTVMDYLPEDVRKLRLYPVGRLDYFSEGLLLLTNDGQLAQRLTHPRHHQPKVYEVLVRGAVPGAALTAMRRGMVLAEGEKLMPVEVDARPAANGTLMRMVLHQGINRQIRRMCRDFGLTILRLKRVAQGPLELGRLALGAARHLTAAEVAALKKSVVL